MTPNQQANNKTIAPVADSMAKCTLYKHRDRAITKFTAGTLRACP